MAIITKISIQKRASNRFNIFLDGKYSFPVSENVLLTHGDSVISVPNGLQIIARSEHAVSGIKHKYLPQYGLQFHPEVDLTINGKHIFKNFLFNICRCKGNFTLPNRFFLWALTEQQKNNAIKISVNIFFIILNLSNK